MKAGRSGGECVVLAAIIVALTFLAFGPAIDAGLIWDDETHLMQCPVIHADDGLYRIWFTRTNPDYFALTWTNYWLEWRLWGDNPRPYHVGNILLHAAASVLFWRVLLRLGLGSPAARFAAVLFAVHPVTTASVAWITERKNVLSVLLMFLSILYYLRSLDSQKTAAYVVSLVWALLALLAKTSVAMLPVVLVILTWYKQGQCTRKDCLRFLPFFLLSLVLGLVELHFEHAVAVYPYIKGYKPRGNYQSLLAEGVESYLVEHPTFFDQCADGRVLNPEACPARESLALNQLIEAPPETIVVPDAVSHPWISRRGPRIDFVRRDAENRRLGRLGEQFALDVERRRLLEAGRDDLASRIEWIAQTRGDGIGFDILSYSEMDDSERLVEVKATGLGKFFPFYVSALEVRCSEATGSQYYLYRVFDFATSPKLYVLRGALSTVCRLDPVQYRAAI